MNSAPLDRAEVVRALAEEHRRWIAGSSPRIAVIDIAARLGLLAELDSLMTGDAGCAPEVGDA